MPSFTLSSPETPLSPRSEEGGSPDSSYAPSPPWSNEQEKSSKRFSPQSTLYKNRRSILVILILLCAAFVWFAPPPSTWGADTIALNLPVSPVQPLIRGTHRSRPDPAKWLRENSGNRHAIQGPGFSKLMQSSKPKAALISLVRNQELEGLLQSMTQLEYRWNHKYQYPWIFFNEEPFSEEFKVRP